MIHLVRAFHAHYHAADERQFAGSARHGLGRTAKLHPNLFSPPETSRNRRDRIKRGLETAVQSPSRGSLTDRRRVHSTTSYTWLLPLDDQERMVIVIDLHAARLVDRLVFVSLYVRSTRLVLGAPALETR